jgi:hypothetical protein
MQHWDLRIPNFLSFNPFPFSDEEFLNDAGTSGEKEGGETDSSSKLLTDQNIIRWRWKRDSDGNPVRTNNHLNSF